MFGKEGKEKMAQFYYRCRDCGNGYIVGEKPKICQGCGSKKIRITPYPEFSWLKRLRKKAQALFPY